MSQDFDSKPSRRTVLKMGAAIAAGAALGTHAEAKEEGVVQTTGSGSNTYEVFHDWLTPPSNIKWGDTHGIAQDAKGRIYIAHTVHPSSESGDAICVFDASGKFLSSWGSQFRGGAHGLDIRKEGGVEYLYHCDVNHRKLAKSTLDGKILWEVGVPMESGNYKDASGWNPTNVAFHPDGDLIVGDGYGSSYVHLFSSSDGKWKKTLIPPGSAAGQVSCPHGVWIDSRRGEPELVVADRGNRRLQRFTLDGKHLGFVTEGMRLPCRMAIQGDLMVIPDLEGVVTVVDKNFGVVAHLCDGGKSPLRDAPREKFIPGQFVHPHGATFLQNGDILVAEWVPIGRITLLKKRPA